MFIAALFIIARTWKQPRCPSADEQFLPAHDEKNAERQKEHLETFIAI